MPEETRRQRRVTDIACELAARYGYLEMSTPIFEFTEVFRRPLGETSDVVSKEMYTFSDRGGEELTLRPEATAAVCRAFLSEGADVEESILFSGAVVGKNCRIRRAIIDKWIQIPDGTEIGYDREADAERFRVTDSGITVVPPGYGFES